MNINTNKLASNSNQFLKKLKEINGKSPNEVSKDKIIKKLKSDFSDILSTNNNFKTRLLSNNKRLSSYEYEKTRLQYMKSKADEIQTLVGQSASSDKINQIINNSYFNQELVLKSYFSSPDNFNTQLSELHKDLLQKEKNLDKEFKAIEIASQNIMSLHSIKYSEKNNQEKFQKLDFENLIKNTKLDTKRVLDLIS